MKNTLLFLLILCATGTAFAHGISEADRQAIAEGGNLRYLWLGAIHMVTGYDHLLFLFGVIFYLTGFKDILKFITAFTLGHSITLVLATFLKITASYYLVDAVIALSVCYKAFDNLDGFRKYLKINSPHLLAMIFLFGLIHGFGLSTRLQQLPLPEEGLLARILSFNVGVELGQVAALSVLVLLLAGWRRTESFRKMGGIANGLLLAAGVGLFIYQINGFFRGEDPHHEEDHGQGGEGHLHGEDGHTHGTEEPTHGEKEHTHGPGGHSHGEPDHSHDASDSGYSSYGVVKSIAAPDTASDSAGLIQESGHEHGTSTKPHGGEAHVHPPKAKASDSAPVTDSLKSSQVQEHSHGAGHTHGGHRHSHDQEGGPKPKRPPAKTPEAHSHESEEPHRH